MQPPDFVARREQLMRRLHDREADQAELDRRTAEGWITLTEFHARFMRKHGRLPFFVAVRILKPVAEALDVAHARNVVHARLSPEQILVQPDGSNPRISDFDGADVLELTRYCAPEQRKGAQVDGKADQFALAAIVVELLTCRHPTSPSGEEISRQTTDSGDPFPGLPDQPDSVQRALARSLDKRPSQRFVSCQQFIEALSADVPTPPPLPAGRLPSSAFSVLHEMAGGRWRMIGGIALTAC